jgi:branched-subunit amino acid ABC-type transport system permease component
VVVGFVKFIAGSGIRSFPVPELLKWNLTLGTLNIPAYRVFFIVTAAIVVFLVHLLLARTMMGIIIRAGTANRPAVEVLGINVKRYFTILFALGSGLAAISAVLTAPLLSVYPSMGDDIILWAFVIVIIGGIGSLKGAVIAGLLIGLLHGVGGIFLGPMSQILTFSILIVLLLLKPEGLFGYM